MQFKKIDIKLPLLKSLECISLILFSANWLVFMIELFDSDN